jgi:hypothetical protein
VEKNGRKKTFKRKEEILTQRRKEKILRENSFSSKPLRYCAFAWKKIFSSFACKKNPCQKKLKENS